jgi:adenine-specific DNA-methyltransferase
LATGIAKTKWVGRKTIHAPVMRSNNGFDFSLLYDGKKSESDVLRTEAARVRLLWRGGSFEKSGTQNRLYYGDNLPILAALLGDHLVRAKVSLVYIDPPFSTRSVFQSRSQAAAYMDLLAGAHYIEFLRERLIILRELMATDGSIYVHLDDNMAFPVKIVMDEVFGRRNFKNWITRKKCNPKNYTRKAYGNISDYILFYTKSHSYTWNRPTEKWTSNHPRLNANTSRRKLAAAT